VFWDKQDLIDGQDWERGFRNGLKHSCLYLPLLSNASLESVRYPTSVSPPLQCISGKCKLSYFCLPLLSKASLESVSYPAHLHPSLLLSLSPSPLLPLFPLSLLPLSPLLSKASLESVSSPVSLHLSPLLPLSLSSHAPMFPLLQYISGKCKLSYLFIPPPPPACPMHLWKLRIRKERRMKDGERERRGKRGKMDKERLHA
jgi:hypothetical protein